MQCIGRKNSQKFWSLKDFKAMSAVQVSLQRTPCLAGVLICWRGQENSAEGSGQATWMEQGQLDEVQQGQGLYPTLGSPQPHGMLQA